MKNNRPLIGITMDWTESSSFSKRPHYAIRQTYFDAVWVAGGMPVGLPLQADGMQGYLERVSGLLIPGGDYPTPSTWYKDPHNLVVTHPRAQVDLQIIGHALDKNLPLLGICAGFQELTVACGGHLHWKVAKAIPSDINHRTGKPEARHGLKIKPGSLLATAVEAERIDVNSAHFEGAADTGTATPTAWADDGLVEAIEVPGKRFALGVQWHPERMTDDAPSRKIFEAFIAAAHK